MCSNILLMNGWRWHGEEGKFELLKVSQLIFYTKNNEIGETFGLLIEVKDHVILLYSKLVGRI